MMNETTLKGLKYLATFRCQHKSSCEEVDRGALCNSCWARSFAETVLEKDCTALEAEVERLKAALKAMTDKCPVCSGQGWRYSCVDDVPVRDKNHRVPCYYCANARDALGKERKNMNIKQEELDGTKGVWRGGELADGTRTTLISCPKCGKICSLSDHTIDDAGKVTPSVVCPREGCGFHEWIFLEGWKLEEATGES